MNRSTLSLNDRVHKAAEILDGKSDQNSKTATASRIVGALEEYLGIEDDEFGEKLIDAETTTDDMIHDALGKSLADLSPKPARMAAAVAVLKGRDPFGEGNPTKGGPTVTLDASASTGNLGADIVVKHLESMRPIPQLKDLELLERYVAERDFEVEQELNRRVKSQPFIILKDDGRVEPGKELIDVEASMDLLKRARKGKVNNTVVPYGDKFANVYRITELNMDERKVELCPVCGESLYKGYCAKCELNFQIVGKHERAYIKLIVDNSGRFQKDSFSDRRALHASAVKGLDDLRNTWPSMSKLFDDLKEADDLPRLVIIEHRPSRTIADPFHVAGNRSY